MDDQFHKVFQKIYNKQDVDDSSEAIKECLDSCGDIKPSKYLKSKALINKKKRKGMKGGITLSKLQYALFKKIKE